MARRLKPQTERLMNPSWVLSTYNGAKKRNRAKALPVTEKKLNKIKIKLNAISIQIHARTQNLKPKNKKMKKNPPKIPITKCRMFSISLNDFLNELKN